MAKRKKRGAPAEPERAAPQNAGDTTVATMDRERIERRAYELYLQRGGADGEAMEDWLAAEREFNAERDKTG